MICSDPQLTGLLAFFALVAFCVAVFGAVTWHVMRAPIEDQL